MEGSERIEKKGKERRGKEVRRKKAFLCYALEYELIRGNKEEEEVEH